MILKVNFIPLYYYSKTVMKRAHSKLNYQIPS